MNSISYTYDVADRLLQADATTYGYDANGNMVSKVESGETTNYAYDYANRLTQLSTPNSQLSYTYDGYGRRISRLTKGSGFGIPEAQYTEYLWDGTNVMLEFYQNKGNPLEYVYGNGQMISRDDLLVLPVSKKLVYQNSHWFHQDGLGSVVNLTDNAGNIKLTYAYDAFGEITKEQGQVGWKKNRYAFTGKPYDPAGRMYYFGARWYEQQTGRFITKDPWNNTPEDERIVSISPNYIIAKLIIQQSLNNPQNTHPYIYCYNNPIVYIDPNGYCGEKILIGGLLITHAELLKMTGVVKGPYVTQYQKILEFLCTQVERSVAFGILKVIIGPVTIAQEWISPRPAGETPEELEELKEEYSNGTQKKNE